MENFYELKGLTWTIEKGAVLKAMNCYEDSPIYEEVAEEYEEIRKKAEAMVEPVGILGFGTLPGAVETKKYKAGTPIIYMVTSIGNQMKEASTRAFAQGDYVKGMLWDTMADDALFSMEDQVLAKLKEICAEHKVGVLARLEAPHDISMESQKTAWEHLELKRRFGIDISSGYMFDPVKTSCQVFILTEDRDLFKAHHDCRKCPNVNCKLRNIPDTEVVVHKGSETETILVKDKESLLEALIRQDYYVSAPCGGKGRCGKCRIRVLSGEADITEEDRAVFTGEELEKGFRLACRLYPVEELEILFSQKDESGFEVLTAHSHETEGESAGEEAYNIAVDIGSTTIAMELLGKESGRVYHTVTMVNEQRVYGADVISRIKASTDGKKQELQSIIRRELQKGVKRLAQETGISPEKIENITIGGNTTMGHLLMGYDCDTLGVAPFTPVNIDFIRGTDQEILGDGTGNTRVTLLPGISTYVGGDIVSGLYACGFDRQQEICLLVDLGTNGEMALGNKDKILVTSTAAGPAFEGGNITWGMGSVDGAICSVKLSGTEAEVRTIRDRTPEGICGTGVVEAAAELVREGIVEDTGTMDEEFFEDGFPLAENAEGRQIVFTRKDVREVQLAKAAVRAGAETLLLRYGIEKADVAKVYIAGGFGYKLNTDKAIAIGMLPEEFKGRIEAVGNSSLAGAEKFLNDPQGAETVGRLVEISREVSLSADKDFNEFYMDAMFFEAE